MPTHGSIHRSRHGTRISPRRRCILSSARFSFVPAPSEEAALVHAIAESGARHVIVGGRTYREALYAALPRGSVVARSRRPRVDRQGQSNGRRPPVHEHSLGPRPVRGRAGRSCSSRPRLGVSPGSPAPCSMANGAAARRRAARQNARPSLAPAAPARRSRGSPNAASACASSAAAKRIDRADASHGRFRSRDRRRGRGAGAGRLRQLADSRRPGHARFINGERLALFQPHAWLINTARGAVVYEAALYDALVDKRLGGAALDVFDREPYVPVDPRRDLRTLPNVILTPHVGSTTPEANRGMAERAVQNIAWAEEKAFARMDLLNPDVLAKTT